MKKIIFIIGLIVVICIGAIFVSSQHIDSDLNNTSINLTDNNINNSKNLIKNNKLTDTNNVNLDEMSDEEYLEYMNNWIEKHGEKPTDDRYWRLIGTYDDGTPYEVVHGHSHNNRESEDNSLPNNPENENNVNQYEE